MLTPNDAGELFQKHLQETSGQKFLDETEKFCPLYPSDKTGALGSIDSAAGIKLLPFQPDPAPLPLEAYLASALTGLGAEEQRLIFELSERVSRVCAEHGISLYEPGKVTHPDKHSDVTPAGVFQLDREKVLGSDLLIHLCHFPSTGAGEELSFAYDALLPIILISHSETRISRMITGIPSFNFEIRYLEPDDLEEQLHDCLTSIRPVLEQRKMAYARKYNVNVVGDRIRLRREELGLTREEVASCVPELTVDHLRVIEESVDRHSNPSLIQLREIATILKTTVADLVEPDLNERLLALLGQWVSSGRTAARFQGISVRDRNKILRRLLLRLIDSLEDET